MNGEGIMGLPAGMSAGMGMPEGGIGEFDSLVQAQQITKDVGVDRVIKELLSAGADIDPYEIREFLEEIRASGMTAEDREVIREIVTRVKADPNNYPSVRQQLLSEGAPEDLLPEVFDPEFFIALELAIQADVSMRSEPQTPVQNFAQGGIAELPQMKAVAAEIARMGRNGDTMLAHITPQEAMMLRRAGGSGTINPYTGLPEFFLKKLFKGVSKAVKSIGKAVKKFAKSTVGRIVISVAAGVILGPAAVGFIQGTGVTLSAAATLGIKAATGSFVSGLAAGDGLKNSLRSAVLAGAVSYGGSALFSGGASMATPAAGTGPQSFTEGLSQGWTDAKNAVNSLLGTEKTIQPSAAEMERLQQEAAIRQAGGPTGTDYLGTGDAQSLLEAQARESISPVAPSSVVSQPLSSATTPLDISREAEGFSPYRETLPSYERPPSLADAQQQAQAIAQARAATVTGAAPPVPLSPPTPERGFAGKVYDFFSPSAREAAAEQAATQKYQEVLARTGNTALAESAYKAALPGMFTKYGPLAAAVGLGATAAMGGFKAPPTDEAPLDFDPVTGLRPGELPFEQRRPDLFGPERRLSPADFTLGQTLVQSPRYSIPAPSGVPVYSPPNLMTFQPGGVSQPYNVSGLYGVPNVYTAKNGSSPEGVTNFPRKTGPINGPGTGTSDSIPAMLSDGEFVFTAKAVRNMGNGSRRKGAARMYKMMKMLEGGPVGAAAKRG